MKYFKEGNNYLTEAEVISAYKEDYVIKDTQMPFRFNVDGLPPEYMRTFESWITWQLEHGTYTEVSVVDFIRFKFETCGLVKYLTSETGAGYEDIVSLTIKNSTVSASDLYEFFSHIKRQMCPNTDEDEFFSSSGLSILHKYINSDVYKEIESRKIIAEMGPMLEERVLLPDDVQKLKFNYWMLTSVLMKKWFREQDQIDVWENTIHVKCINSGVNTGLELGKDYRAVEDSYYPYPGVWHIYDAYDKKFRGKFLKEKFEEMEVY